MDLNQRKLNKSEWSSIEVPVSTDEQNVLNMIVAGFSDVNIKQNHTTSVFTYLKIEFSEKMEDYLYNNYLAARCVKLQESIKYIDATFVPVNVNSNIKINSADKIRLERNDEKTLKKQNLYEYLLITYAEKFAHYKLKEITKSPTKRNSTVSQSSMYYYYTLYKLLRNNVVRVNKHVLTICNNILDLFCDITHDIYIYANAFFAAENFSRKFKEHPPIRSSCTGHGRSLTKSFWFQNVVVVVLDSLLTDAETMECLDGGSCLIEDLLHSLLRIFGKSLLN